MGEGVGCVFLALGSNDPGNVVNGTMVTSYDVEIRKRDQVFRICGSRMYSVTLLLVSRDLFREKKYLCSEGGLSTGWRKGLENKEFEICVKPTGSRRI